MKGIVNNTLPYIPLTDFEQGFLGNDLFQELPSDKHIMAQNGDGVRSK
jgi:hypothetical protein